MEQAWDGTAEPKYTFVSEGDNVAFLNLINNGLDSTNPTYGGWGGRQYEVSASPLYFSNVASDTYTDGTHKQLYDWARWFPAAQLDFAARLKWGITPNYRGANHAPVVRTLLHEITARPGETVRLRAFAFDPDHNELTVDWWQYRDAETYPGVVSVTNATALCTSVTVPQDAQSGQTIHLILQVTDNGTPALTSYQRVVITVK